MSQNMVTICCGASLFFASLFTVLIYIFYTIKIKKNSFILNNIKIFIFLNLFRYIFVIFIFLFLKILGIITDETYFLRGKYVYWPQFIIIDFLGTIMIYLVLIFHFKILKVIKTKSINNIRNIKNEFFLNTLEVCSIVIFGIVGSLYLCLNIYTFGRKYDFTKYHAVESQNTIHESGPTSQTQQGSGRTGKTEVSNEKKEE